MRHQIWTFFRLLWGEWSSRVTGSLSALLVLAGLGISLAGAFGAKIPADSVIQLGTWVLGAICGGQAAYLVWAREHAKVVTLEHRLTPRFDLQYESNDPICKASLKFGEARAEGRGFRIRAENIGENTIYGCEARLVEAHHIDKPNELSSTKLIWVGDTDTVDLVKGAPEYVGVLSVISTGVKQVPAKGWSIVQLEMFDNPGEYIFKVVVNAKNVQPKEYSVIATLTNDWRTADMRPL